MAERALVAMSGGVDSTVAAALLLEQGLEVHGAHLRLLPCELVDDAGQCCGQSAGATARQAAEQLGISFHLLDVSARFSREVLAPAWEAYRTGRTPNPCVRCNRLAKLDPLAELAADMGASWVATGHYARVEHTSEGTVLRQGLDAGKDQSYFLWDLGAEHLSRLLLPLGGLSKVQVREHARRLGLANAERADSQDACLVATHGGLGEALRHAFDGDLRPGAIVDEEGRELGRHMGIHCYTLGQRRGLGVALGQPAFVCAIHPETDQVVLTTDSSRLMGDRLVAEGVRWLVPEPEGPVECRVKVRYRHPGVPAVATPLPGGRAEVVLGLPARAITPGQAAVMYQGDKVIGGGWIC